MRLLIFAHRGEAQTFIKKRDFKSLDFNIYQYENEYLYICGEGIYEVMSMLSQIIKKYEINEIINYGISGSLDEKIEIDSIHEVRTSYHQNYEEMEFKSFTLNKDADLDCISTTKRVLTDKQGLELKPFGDIIDRELWAMAYVANKLSISLRSFKLISDFAGNMTDCFDLKQRAHFFSEKLYSHYQQSFLESTKINEDKQKQPIIFYPFRLTQFQRNRLNKIIPSIDEIFLKEQIKEISEYKIQDKEKANKLINRCFTHLYPIKAKINSKIESMFFEFNSIGAKISFDENLEKEYFNLSMQINSQTNIDKLKAQLDELKYNEFKSIFEGDIDV